MVYYINHDRIGRRQQFLLELARMAERLSDEWHDHDLPSTLAQERVLHLAIEAVTDIGSDYIDGFVMRDASSYEDIIEILRDEKAIDQELAEFFTELVRLRKPLVQDYTDFPRGAKHPMLAPLSSRLTQYVVQMQDFMKKQPLI